jgi:hypothetical protein
LKKLRRFASLVVITPRRRLDEMALLPTKRISSMPVLSPSTTVNTTSIRPFGRSTTRDVTWARPRPVRR